jgi:hypothetical protein
MFSLFRKEDGPQKPSESDLLASAASSVLPVVSVPPDVPPPNEEASRASSEHGPADHETPVVDTPASRPGIPPAVAGPEVDPATPKAPGATTCGPQVCREPEEYERVDEPTRPHPEKVCRFERAKPNQLWQTDLFTFVLKRQNRRVYLVAFLDDHSRFLVSYGLHASASTALVLETLEAGIAAYGPPEEILTDNGPQYVTWRGKSQFTRRLEQRGIRQIVARPKRPQTLGKIERFWGTLWREFLETAVFVDLAEARTRIGLFIDYHNFQRVHRGIDGLVPADRFFGAASEVARTLKARVAANALELARQGVRPAPFYVTGQLDGQSFSVHAEGPRLILTRPGQPRQEVELSPPTAPSTPTAPAVSGESPDAPRTLPRPVCPEGSPQGATDPDAGTDTASSQPEPPLPGGDA